MSSWKNKIISFLVFGLILIETIANAQRKFDPESNPAFKERMYYGGNFGFQFGTVTLIDVSPLAGVMLNSKLSAGLGATYQYYDDRRFQGSTGSSYGGRVFARYNVLPNVFTYSEFESINWNAYNYFNDRFQRTWTDAFFIGAGYFTPFGPRGGANFTFLYNLMHDNRNSYYNEPYVIRVGFVL